MTIRQGRYIVAETEQEKKVRVTEIQRAEEDPFIRRSEVQQKVNNSTLPVSSRAVKLAIDSIESPSLDGYATEDYVDQKLDSIDLSSYASTAYVDGKLEEVGARVDSADEKATEALNNSSEALESANTALGNANTALSTAQGADDKAQNALDAAQSALDSIPTDYVKDSDFNALSTIVGNKRDLDDNVFNGLVTIKSDSDEQGTGVLLQESDGTVRGQVVATDQGLQLTQYPKDGGLQTFTFPSEGGEVSIATTKVVSTENELHDALLRGDRSIYVTSKSGYITLTRPITDIKPNTVLSFDPALTVRDNYTGGFTFNLKGELGGEVKLTADAVSGDRTITVESTSSFKVGDWVLLKSNQACSHESAGDWQLGETTGSNAHVYFGEPKQIESIEGNVIKFSSTILFPNYKASGAGTAVSRANSTIQKLSTVKGITINAPCRWEKGKGFVFNGVLLEDADINFTDIQKDGSRGTQVTHRKCLNSRFTVKHTRPTGWSLGSEDHSLFNSVKDVGSWWCETNLIDINGCQGADQTYEDVPSLFPRFNVKSFNNIEDGATSHGNSFGGRFIIESYGSILCGFRNRSRFCEEVDVTVTGASYGIVASSFGAHNNAFKIHATNVRDGVRIMHKGVTQVSPARKDLVITGSIRSEGVIGRYAIMIDNLEDSQDRFEYSGITLKDLYITGYERPIRGGKYVNGICFDGVTIKHSADKAPIYLPSSSGNSFVKLHVVLPDGVEKAIYGNKNLGADNVRMVDYNTKTQDVIVENGALYVGTEHYFATSQDISSTTSNTAYRVRGGSNVYLNVTRNDRPQGVRLSLNASTIGECEFDVTLSGEDLGSDVIGVFGVEGTNVVWTGTQSSKVEGGLSLNGTVTLRIKVFKDTVLVDCP